MLPEPIQQGAPSAFEGSQARDAFTRTHVCAPGESDLEQVSARVAEAVSLAESPAERDRWQQRFFDWMRTGRFLPSVPILANAARGAPLAACYVLQVQDSLASIYAGLARAAVIQQGSGGSGIDLSALRPRGAPIARSGGTSPGPVGFLDLFASSARTNRCSGRRPGAHLLILRHDHADVLDFVRAKRDSPQALDGVGLAVAVGDAFFEAVERNEQLDLSDEHGRTRGRMPARFLLAELAAAIWETGEPSLLFVDAIQRANPVPELGEIRATNPCGEQPLLPDESCVLGSLHLPAFCDGEGRIDSEQLDAAIRDAIRFLDDVVDVNPYPEEQIQRATSRTRKLGLGVMGLADVFLLRGLAYGSAPALDLAAAITGQIQRTAREASRQLALEKGPFPACPPGAEPSRNATLLAIAPTGTLRLIVGCSGGIEPFIRPVFETAQAQLWTDRWLGAWAQQNASDGEALLQALLEECPTGGLPGLSPAAQGLLRRAWEINPEEQIELQARVQGQIDGAVSKTVHLSEPTRAAEIASLISLAQRSGCKGVSLFRRGCAASQHPET